MHPRTARSVRNVLVAALLPLAFAGCYSPGGGLFKRSGGGYTYISTEMRPVTITVVDTRTEQPFYKLEIPPGKQLTMNFLEGKGDDPVLRPDRMVYSIFDAGKSTGRLTNQLTCPPAACRRIDYTIRPAPEYRDEPPEFIDRVDGYGGKPPWWTPAGGPLPPETKFYD